MRSKGPVSLWGSGGRRRPTVRKLYVSLLIFVYSLMDSDERASLPKKMF